MNKITKRSFYSFLALYLISSFIFLSIAAYWFFTSQVAMEKSNNFYKMNHTTDLVSSKIIYAHMDHTPFKLEKFEHNIVSVFDKNKKLLYGMIIQPVDFHKEYYMKDGIFTLVTQRVAGHLGAQYVVVQSGQCVKNIEVIKNKIAYAVIITAFLIIFIAVILSYIFLKPIKDKMQEIEDFVKDTTHELNTPITAIMMSSSRLKSKKKYDENIVRNISISTKQLYDIYASLSFLSFDTKSEAPLLIAFDMVVQEDINYFGELLQKKNIILESHLQACELNIAPSKAKMLINNLLSNAIKYSHPNTKIKISLTQHSLTIEDEGIGIAKEKLNEIFKRFVRANSYAGGFGVGLNIVESIVKEYDFKIKIDSKEHIGTKITVIFKD
jgi:two-component system OmpR family sensor kinase